MKSNLSSLGKSLSDLAGKQIDSLAGNLSDIAAEAAGQIKSQTGAPHTDTTRPTTREKPARRLTFTSWLLIASVIGGALLWILCGKWIAITVIAAVWIIRLLCWMFDITGEGMLDRFVQIFIK